MTKEEAIQAMTDGKKVAHVYFERHEWATMHSPNVVTHEDGAEMPLSSFLDLRKHPEWDRDWYEWEPVVTKQAQI